ncbi:MAG: AtpZ/AtpI family protein [Deltaproteobacteria bacterium]|nr:AtpZ/AtpI family protein [Deltaproteobacteria bacterium]
MSYEKNRKNDEASDNLLSRQVGIKEQRKLKARRERDRGVWFGLGMFGLVGWSVAVPALIATAIGLWLDKRLDDQYSWTLMMIFIGVVIGCMNAWYWVKKENARDR